jgi:hypothetical protein
MITDNKLHTIVNGTVMLEYDRGKPVPGHQRQYLDTMDTKMDAGIQVGDDHITNPNPMQKAQFVANSLVNALFQENDSLAIAMCTYLAKRIPDLKQIKAIGDIEKEISVELVFDRDYETAQQEKTIEFFKDKADINKLN